MFSKIQLKHGIFCREVTSSLNLGVLRATPGPRGEVFHDLFHDLIHLPSLWGGKMLDHPGRPVPCHCRLDLNLSFTTKTIYPFTVYSVNIYSHSPEYLCQILNQTEGKHGGLAGKEFMPSRRLQIPWETRYTYAHVHTLGDKVHISPCAHTPTPQDQGYLYPTSSRPQYLPCSGDCQLLTPRSQFCFYRINLLKCEEKKKRKSVSQ